MIWTYGIAMLDVVAGPVDRWPGPGGLVVAENGLVAPGGVALNTAVAVARLGGSVGLIAGVGRDRAGEMLVRGLAEEGVDVGLLVTDDARATGFCIVGVDSRGEKWLVAFLGANEGLTPEAVRWGETKPGDTLHVGGCFALAQLRGEMLYRIVRAAKQRGMVVSLESAWDVTGSWLAGSEEALTSVDVLMASDSEAEAMTGEEDPVEACTLLASCGPSVVVVKAGARGSFICSRGRVHHQPAFRVALVDATGAGDAYCGGFLFGLTQGWGPERCAELGAGVAALTVSAMGSTAGLCDLETTVRFMAEATKLP